MRSLLRTDDDLSLLVTRVVLGVVIFPHGAQKVLGWFGGPGLEQIMGIFTGQLQIPAFLAVAAIAAEFLGSLALVVGLLTRVAALGIACVMLGAIRLAHLPNGFFMNWSGQQAGEGFEFHILAIGMALALVIGGAGKASLDRALARG